MMGSKVLVQRRFSLPTVTVLGAVLVLVLALAGQASASGPPPSSTASVAAASQLTLPAPQTMPTSTDIFTLHSDPGSTHPVFLDFDGAVVAGTLWNDELTVASIDVPPYDTDGDPAQWSTAEREFVYEVWREVSEYYVALDIDVTTEQPDPAELSRESDADPAFGTTMLFATDPAVKETVAGTPGVTGVDHVASFRSSDYSPGFVFVSAMSGPDVAREAAMTAAHETGHSLGLTHAYDYSKLDMWIPLMRADGPYRPLHQFVPGEFDDVTRFFVPFRADDYGDRTDTAEALGANTHYSLTGVIGRHSAAPHQDLDVFEVEHSCATSLTAQATNSGRGSALDLKVDILDADGTVLTSADPPPVADSNAPAGITGLNATAELNDAPSNTYFVRVSGTGYEDPAGGGYTDYGSLGTYTLDISGCPSPVEPDTPTNLQADNDHDWGTVSWEAPADDGNSPITGYRISVDGTVTTLDADTLSYGLTGLTGGTSYAIAVIAVNAVGTSRPASLTLTTPTWAPTVTPELTVTTDDARPGSLELSWTDPPNPGNATITGWRLHLSTADSDAVHELPPGTHSTTLSGLAAGDYTVVLEPQVSADQGDPVAASAHFHLDPQLEPLAVASTRVPAATVGQEYHAALEATGGVDSVYTWSLAGGSLPPGLTLRADGAITGTPTQAGAFQFTVSVNDPAFATFTLTVKPAAEDSEASTGGSDVNVLGGTVTGSAPLVVTGVAVQPTLAGGGLLVLLGVLMCAIGGSFRRRSLG